MKSNAECLRPQLVGLAIVTSLLSACATVSSESVTGVCPPVVEYSQAKLVRAAEEVTRLPESSPIVEMLSDYFVIREQAKSCQYKDTSNSSDKNRGSLDFEPTKYQRP